MPKTSKKVLVVEDEKPLAHALELKLQKEGHDVTIAHNGEEAVSLLLKHTYDIVLLDLMMPVMNGFQVLEKLQAHGEMPYVIVLSNLTQPEDEDRVMALGARKLLIKSDTPLSQVIAEIDQL